MLSTKIGECCCRLTSTNVYTKNVNKNVRQVCQTGDVGADRQRGEATAGWMS